MISSWGEGDGQINGKKRQRKTLVLWESASASETGVYIPTGSEIPKGSSSSLASPRTSTRADGDRRRTRWSENAPLTSDAPNAIRTTHSLPRNISQIGVECLAANNFTRSTRPSRFTRAYFQIRKPRSYTDTAGYVVFNRFKIRSRPSYPTVEM